MTTEEREQHNARHRRWREANKDRLNAYAKKRRAERRDEENAYHRNWRKANPNKVRLIQAKYRYGVSAKEYQALLLLQDNKCLICLSEFDSNSKRTTAHVDHSHISGEIRGLLCDWCNKGLGIFEDNIDRLSRAIKYLTK